MLPFQNFWRPDRNYYLPWWFLGLFSIVLQRWLLLYFSTVLQQTFLKDLDLLLSIFLRLVWMHPLQYLSQLERQVLYRNHSYFLYHVLSWKFRNGSNIIIFVIYVFFCTWISNTILKSNIYCTGSPIWILYKVMVRVFWQIYQHLGSVGSWVVGTDYGHTMATSLILCGPNSNPKYIGI